MLNSSYLVEIKIGQGAKPGEGGHLPAKKVSEKVAAARNASPGTDLISPSNNHDLYSIEDLAELIDELKTANPDVRVSVKVPVVPNIGTIGVGIAKAGADIITLSGFEGGTGAARQHALRHVGLPSDIGTRAVHLALLEAGIRNRVEIWADGGYRHGWDIVKLHCLGANRVAFGTLAMVSIGCTICRGCQLDTCHVGIATQIEDMEEAEEKGLKKFTPAGVRAAPPRTARASSPAWARRCARSSPTSATSAPRTWSAAATCSCRRAPRSAIDLTEMIRPLEEMLDLEPIDMPVSAEEEREAAGLIVARPIRMEPKQASQRARGAGDGRLRRAGEHHRSATEPRRASTAEARRCRVHAHAGRVAHEYPRPVDANDRVLGTELAGAALARPHLPARQRTAVHDGHGRRPALQRRLDRRLGPRRVQRLGRRHPRRGRRAGRRRQDDVRRHDRGHEGHATASGERVNGSVGKSFAYGAQRGRFFVQGSADSRFCIRLSGADVVIAGEPDGPDPRRARRHRRPRQHQGLRVRVHDRRPRRRARRHRPVGLRRPDRRPRLHARQRRVGARPRGARAAARQGRQGRARRSSTTEGVADVQELLGHYADELERSEQHEEAQRIRAIAADAAAHFLMSVPEREQTDPSVSTE